MMRRVAPTVLAVLIATTLSAAVATAAARVGPSAVTACMNSHRVLVLATKKGHCPKGDSKASVALSASAPGPSVYVNREHSADTINDHDIINKLSLPKGTYMLTSVTDIYNNDTGADNASCSFQTAGHDGLSRSLAAPEGPSQIVDQDVVRYAKATKVRVTCSSSSGAVAYYGNGAQTFTAEAVTTR
jgi:hypothetical protein